MAPDILNFPKRLEIAIAMRGFTQKELAERIGVTPVSVYRYVKGQRSPDIDILFKICTTLHVSSDYLLGLKEIG